MSEHTPGPWKTRSEYQSYIPANVGSIEIDGGIEADWVVAAIPADIPEAEANARLIAAAPALLEALQIICTNAKMQPDASMNGATDCYAVPLDDIDTALALIAQAKGEQK